MKTHYKLPNGKTVATFATMLKALNEDMKNAHLIDVTKE